ncbi:MAG: phage holin family protein [Chthoniobacteraceae bacterium]
MKPFLFRWASTTFAVLVATAFVPGISADSTGALIWAGLLLGVLNAVIRPVLLFFALPLVVLTLGLFVPVINAVLLHFVGSGWVDGFHVAGFGSAFLGAIVVSIASWMVNGFVNGPRAVRFEVHAPRHFDEPAPRPGEMKRVEGRVIDHESDPR